MAVTPAAGDHPFGVDGTAYTMWYRGYMAKTLIEIDEAVLAAAAVELGTTTKKDTVNEALKMAAGRRQRAQAVLNRLHDLWGQDISNPEVMAQARR